MAEASNVDLYTVIWGVIKYIGIGIISLISMFLLWLLGKYRGEHEEMYKQYIEKNGKEAQLLAEKHKEEFDEIITVIKELKHSVNQLRQNQTNIGSFSKQLERIEDDIHELKSKL